MKQFKKQFEAPCRFCIGFFGKALSIHLPESRFTFSPDPIAQ
ncbi:MAG TPA: hypothetical protein VF350_01990 [Candidatus Bathyarchaeia archaeon]